MSKILYHLNFLFKQKKLFAWLSFVLLVISGLLIKQFPNLFMPVFLMFLSSILLVLLEIHTRLIDNEKKIFFLNLSDAWPEINKEVEKALEKNGSEICWQGVTLGDAWPHLSAVFRKKINEQSLQEATITFTQADPKFWNQYIVKYDSLKFKAVAAGKEIEDFKNVHKDQFKRIGFNIHTYRYDYLPSFHGILINNTVLFLSHAIWDGNTLLVADEPYECFDKGTKRGDYYIRLFNSWLDATKKHHNELTN